MSKVAIKHFQLSEHVAKDLFYAFGEKLVYFAGAREKYHKIMGGKVKFTDVEMDDYIQEYRNHYVNTVEQAMHALFRLNRVYKAETGVNIVGHLESFDEKVDVLIAIENYFIEFAAESKAKRKAQSM